MRKSNSDNNGEWGESEMLIRLHDKEKLLSTLRRFTRKHAKENIETLISSPTWEKLKNLLCRPYRFWHGVPYILRDLNLDAHQTRFNAIIPDIEQFFDEIIQQADTEIKLRELLQYLKSALIAARKSAQEIVVNGLFALQNQGCVNEFSDEVPEDLFKTLISGSLLKISSPIEEEEERQRE